MSNRDVNQGPPHHSRPDLFASSHSGDQETEVLQPRQAQLSTLIVDEAPVEAISETWHVGYRLDDRYVIREIRGGQGSSGMGVVFIVEDDRGEWSAVKTLQRRYRRDLFLLQRFVREARTWMLVGAHPNIVRAKKLEIVEAAPCLFMELVPSDTLGTHSLSQRLNRGPLSIAESLDAAHQFCIGMIHATRAVPGLVHRDIKPDNLLVAPDGTVKITDFGLVRTKSMEDDSLEQWAQSEVFEDFSKDITRIGSVFGTPAYMAPEQFTRPDEVDFRADIYGMGCCLYEFLTGAPPFKLSSDSSGGRLGEMRRKHLSEIPVPLREALGPSLPASVDALVRRCLAKDPRKRWDSYEDFSIAILSIMDSLGLSPREIPVPTPSPADVAAQMRSITLLEGYDQAIHMRKLREGQEESPYAFHLALASYFHCVDDVCEEEHQLGKALALKGDSAGYEAIRRLSELWIKQGHAARADVVLRAYLALQPNTLEQLLEPVVRVACAYGHFEEALETLAMYPSSFRVLLLRSEIMRARGDEDALRGLLRDMQASVLADIRQKLADLTPDDTVGWSRRDDRAALEMVLGSVAPDINPAPLRTVDHAIWPDIGGYPDFAPDLAWLSYTLGELAALDGDQDREKTSEFGRFATFLGYPSRLEKHLERDEYWFWMRETQLSKRNN